MCEVSRKEVIEYAKEKRHELIDFWEDYKHENREVKYYDFIINSLETDEAYQLEYERLESGTWQQINKNEVNVIPEWKCSECGAEFECFDMDFDYCPRCGAKMESEDKA